MGYATTDSAPRLIDRQDREGFEERELDRLDPIPHDLDCVDPIPRDLEQLGSIPRDLERLGEEIASLAAHIDVATHRLLVMLARFDRKAGWKAGGHASCAHWLSWRTGVDLGAAREKVRAARALEGLPKTSVAMSEGKLSFSKVRALTRVANEENEGELLELAMTRSTARVERVVRSWKRHSRLDEQELERLRHESRMFSVFPDDEGMYVVKGRLDPEVGALLIRAIEAASDELYKSEGKDERQSKEPRQRRADAVGLVAERALAVASGDQSRADRFQVTLHVDRDTLSEDTEPGTSELEDGTRVSAETSRRLSCDAGLVVIEHDKDGRVLDVGREEADRVARDTASVVGPGPRMCVSGLWQPVHGESPRAALGRRRGNQARQPGVALQEASPGGARRGMQRRGWQRPYGSVLRPPRAGDSGSAEGWTELPQHRRVS